MYKEKVPKIYISQVKELFFSVLFSYFNIAHICVQTTFLSR